jgi:hypothetical protein
MKTTYTLLIGVLLSLSASAQFVLPQGLYHNKIDDVKTADDIHRILTTIESNDSDFVATDQAIGIYENANECKRIKDSLGVRPWTKADLDGNGYSDLLAVGMKQDRFTVLCIMDSGRDHFYTVPLTTLDFQSSTYPVVRVINGQCAVLYYEHRNKHSWIDSSYSSDRLYIDTLIFRSGFLTEINLHPVERHISEISFNREGGWGGDWVSVFMDTNGPVSRDMYKTPEGKARFLELSDLLNYSDFSHLDSSYTVQWTDDQTATLKVTYDGGKVKTIRDYGLQGSFGLMHIYARLYDIYLEEQKYGLFGKYLEEQGQKK